MKTTIARQFEVTEKYFNGTPEQMTEAATYLDEDCSYYFYDWFCKDSSLKGKFEKLFPKVKAFVEAAKIDKDKFYFWFKNNCPMQGGLYDDFRISHVDSDTNEWVCKYRDGKYSLYRGPHWDQPVAEGSWTTILEHFKGPEKQLRKEFAELKKGGQIPVLMTFEEFEAASMTLEELKQRAEHHYQMASMHAEGGHVRLYGMYDKEIKKRTPGPLPFYSYTKAGGIIVSIQFNMSNDYLPWDSCPATLHECKDWQQAATIAQGIANTTGRQVRMTMCDNTHVTQEQVGRQNGAYFNRK